MSATIRDGSGTGEHWAGQVGDDQALREGMAVASELAQERMNEAIKKIKRVYVAVHGIGDQLEFATIQSVANRLGKYLNTPLPVPLGSFHSESVESHGFLILDSPLYPKRFRDVGLAEIYWANIPRKIQKEGYTLEEAKKWATTLVERIRMRQGTTPEALSSSEYQMLEQVIGEMIEGVAILDRLLFLVGKVTPYRFQLKDLLDSFLGDVQVVTDFQAERDRLLARFREVMDKIQKANPEVEIYLVAHSEGTVVAFLGLLKAFNEYQPAREGREERHGWIRRVRGLMTFGSPIEEHLLLWPELLEDDKGRTCSDASADGWDSRLPDGFQRIEWRNYLDFGDPIAYRLTKTSEWLRKHGWDRVFHFDPREHEYAFARYLFPGKAHLDYWGDKEVFGHFLETVATPEKERTGRFRKPPRSRPWISLPSRVLPYAIPLGLIVTAVYILFRAVWGFVSPSGFVIPDDFKYGKSAYISMNVAGISLLLVGITVVTRVARLSRSWIDWMVAYLVFLACAAAYPPLTTSNTHEWLGHYPAKLFGLTSARPLLGLLPAPYDGPALGLILVAAVLVLVAMQISSMFPRLGAKGLIVPGIGVVVLILGYGIARSMEYPDQERGPIWMVLLAGLAFLYLWWLAVVLFDLIYVWHHYIRGTIGRGTMADRLGLICEGPSDHAEGAGDPGTGKAPGAIPNPRG